MFFNSGSREGIDAGDVGRSGKRPGIVPFSVLWKEAQFKWSVLAVQRGEVSCS